MLIIRSRSLTALAAGALMLTALAGCGSDDKKDADAKSTSSPSSSPSASSSTGTDAPGAGDTAAAAPGERLTKANLVATMLAAMREKKTAHMSMDIGSSVSADAQVRYSGSGTDMKMSMDMGPTKAMVILINGVMYMQQTAGGKYLKIDKDTPNLGQMVEQMSSLGPQSSIAAMNAGLKKLEYLGSAKVDGTDVDKYRVTVDTAGMAKTLGAAGGGGDLPKTVTYTLYVDNDHLMRRLDMTISDQEITMDVGKWGEPVDIKAPRASQIESE